MDITLTVSLIIVVAGLIFIAIVHTLKESDKSGGSNTAKSSNKSAGNIAAKSSNKSAGNSTAKSSDNSVGAGSDGMNGGRKMNFFINSIEILMDLGRSLSQERQMELTMLITAAENGDSNATVALGDLYASAGRPDKATQYYMMAAAAGNSQARQKMQEMLH